MNGIRRQHFAPGPTMTLRKTDSRLSQVRKVNYLPDMEYSYSNFLKFTDERRELIKARFEELLL